MKLRHGRFDWSLCKVFKSICWKFGDFSIVCSIFMEVDKATQKYKIRYRSSNRWPNNPRRKQATTLKCCLWLVQVIKMIFTNLVSFLFTKIGTLLHRFFLFYFSGSVDAQWTSIERLYPTCGRPKGTFNGRLVDVPNETQLICPNRTKMDVHFRPSKDAKHGTWMSSGPPPDVYWMPIFDWWFLDILLDLHQTSYAINIAKYPISSFSNFWLELWKHWRVELMGRWVGIKIKFYWLVVHQINSYLYNLSWWRTNLWNFLLNFGPLLLLYIEVYTKNEDCWYWQEETNSICKIMLYFKQNHHIGSYIYVLQY